MSGLNQCSFIGNVGRDPEMRSTNGGKKVVNFSLAVNERKDSEPLWINVVAFDKTAEICEKYATKGKQVFISGRLQIRKYQAKDGTEKQSTEVVVSQLVLLGGKSDGDPAPRSRSKPAPEGGDDFGPPPGSDDNLPF